MNSWERGVEMHYKRKKRRKRMQLLTKLFFLQLIGRLRSLAKEGKPQDKNFMEQVWGAESAQDLIPMLIVWGAAMKKESHMGYVDQKLGDLA
jgi:hypothetical protein